MILSSEPEGGGFQFMLILDLWGISFHPVVVVGLGNDLLFNFIIGHCVTRVISLKITLLKSFFEGACRI